MDTETAITTFGLSALLILVFGAGILVHLFTKDNDHDDFYS